MKTTGIIIQARMGSTRLPEKIFLNLKGKPVLGHVIDRCKRSKVNKIIIATSIKKENNVVEDFCKKNNILCFRGSEEDVLERYYLSAKEHNLGVIVRITSDCPLIDPKIINFALKSFKKTKVDYLSNAFKRSFPRGLDVEVFSFKTLEKAYHQAKDKFQREHVTLYIYNNPKEFKLGSLMAKGKLKRPDLRLCVDTVEDFKLLEIIYNKFYKGSLLKIKKIIRFLDKNPKLAKMNLESEKQHVVKNESSGAHHKFIKN